MLYLLDANTLIDAKRDYYPIESIPEYWDWLIHMGSEGKIKIPEEVYEEFSDTVKKDGKQDDLASWASQDETKGALLLDEEVNVDLVKRVTYGGYLPNPSDQEVESMGRDPFLIAHALLSPSDRCVVSTEVSKPSKKGANRRVPDVCTRMGVRCINGFGLIRELNFRTNWRESV